MTAAATEKETIESLLLRGFCTGIYARNRRGDSVNVKDPEACSWCLLGAASRVYMGPRFETAIGAMRDFIKTTVYVKTDGVVFFNDNAPFNLIIECARAADKKVREVYGDE